MDNIKKFSEQIILEMIDEITRASMPQVRSKDIDEVLKTFDEYGIAYEQGNAKCGDLKPVQDDFIPEKLESLKKKIQEEDWVTHPLFVSMEGNILDGHHRWLAYREIYGDDFQIPVTKVDLPLDQALQVFDDSASEVNEGISEGKEIKNVVAVAAGRFQPFHKGHYSMYEILAKKFGKKNTYISTSNIVVPGKSPFNFMEKKQIISKMFGIPKDKIVKVKSPFKPVEIVSKYDPETTAYVTIFSEKDVGRLGGKYFKKWTGKNVKGYNDEGYFITAPVLKINVNGKNISGTQLRTLFGSDELSEKGKKALFKKLYGKFDQKTFDLMTKKLSESVILGSSVIEDFIIEINVKQLLLETSQADESVVDDGPATFYKHPEHYHKDVKDIIGNLGWQIIDFLAGDKEEYTDQRYKYDHVSDVSFGDVGVRDTTYPDPIAKYQAHMKHIAARLGYSIVDWLMTDKKKENIIDDPESEMATKEPLVQDTSDAAKPLKEQLFSKEWWTDNVMTDKQPLKEGIDYVVCRECGDRMSQIQYRHLYYEHDGMTLEEYRKKYPKATLVAEVAKNIGDKNPMKNEENKRKHLEVMKSKEISEKISKKMTGRVFSEVHKNNISKNNGMNKKENRKKVSIGVKNSYKNNPELRKLRANTFGKSTFSDKYREKMYSDGLWTRPEDRRPFDMYRNEVRSLTEESYRKFFNEIPNAKKRSRNYHLDHKYSISNGFTDNIPPEIVGHYKNLEIVYHVINESKAGKSSISIRKLIKDIKYSGDPLDDRILLQCGGAFGHLAHPFDDMDLTFGELRMFIENAIDGKLESVQEKIDGQNIMVSWKDGKLIAARNKGHIKNFGAEALSTKQISDMFAGRGAVHDAFTFAMQDLEKAISKLTDKQKTKVFGRGKNFMNIEVVYPATTNVIPYDFPILIFHGAVEYDEDGNPVGRSSESARMLDGMIRQINQEVQTNFTLSKNPIISLPKTQDFSNQKGAFVNRLNKLKGKYKLKDTDKIIMYHQMYWEDFIVKQAKKFKYKLPNSVMTNLVKRWAYGDKSYKISDIKKEIDNEKFLTWVLDFDKTKYAEQVKKNLRPFELLFLELGAQVLKNLGQFLAVAPDSSKQRMKKELEKTVKELEATNDVTKMKKLKVQLDRLNAIGGFDAIVPTEGITFMYKAKLYKLTGAFAPINRIMGALKFGN